MEGLDTAVSVTHSSSPEGGVLFGLLWDHGIPRRMLNDSSCCIIYEACRKGKDKFKAPNYLAQPMSEYQIQGSF